MPRRVEGIGARIGMDTTGFQQGIGAALQSLGRLDRALVGIGATVAGGAFLKGAISEAIEFEEELAQIRKVTDRGTMQRLRSEIDSLTSEIPLAREQMTGIVEDAGRLGVQGTENISDFTETVGKISIATDIAAQSAGQDFARIAAVTRTPIGQLENLGSVINELSNNMATSGREVTEGMLRMGAAASRFGLSAPEIAAVAASINEVSASARRGNTRVRRFFQNLTNPNKIANFADALNMNVEQFKAMREAAPVQLLRQLVQVMARGGEGAAKLRSEMNSTSRQALAGLAQNLDGLNEALGQHAEQWQKNTSLQREYNIQADTAKSRMQLLRNESKKLQRQIGEEMLPAQNKIMKATRQWAGAINRLIFRQTELNKAMSQTFGARQFDRLREQLTVDIPGSDIISGMTAGVVPEDIPLPGELTDTLRRRMLEISRRTAGELENEKAQRQIQQAIIDNVRAALEDDKAFGVALSQAESVAIQMTKAWHKHLENQGKDDVADGAGSALDPNQNDDLDDAANNGGDETAKTWRDALKDGIDERSIMQALSRGASEDQVRSAMEGVVRGSEKTADRMRDIFMGASRDIRKFMIQQFGKEMFAPAIKRLEQLRKLSPVGKQAAGIGAGRRGEGRATSGPTEAEKQGIFFGGRSRDQLRKMTDIRFGGSSPEQLRRIREQSGIRFGGGGTSSSRRDIEFEPVDAPLTIELDGREVARQTLKLQPKERRRTQR